MPKAKGGPNQKVASAAEKKAAAQAVKDAKAAQEKEKELQAEWSKGANNRGLSRADAAAEKADEAARKKREKAALLAEEEAALGAGGKAKKTPALSKKNKKGNDLSLLENALVSGAEKKMKAKKQAELEKAEKAKAEQMKKKEEEKPMDPLLANTEEMIRGTADDLVGRAANKALDEENAVSGIDGALETLNVGGEGGTIVTSAKALYKAFEERMLPEVKQDYPGLKLSQYKEKIFQMWKKSPENPANQP
jgi:hypothetical protein